MALKMRIEFLAALLIVASWVSIPVSYADDAEQSLSDLIPTDSAVWGENGETVEDSPFLQDMNETEDPVVTKKFKEESFAVPGTEQEAIDTRVNQTEATLLDSQNVLGANEDSAEYAEISTRKILREFKNKGKQDFSFLFYRDDYVYDNGKNNFETIFRDNGSKPRHGLILRLLGNYYLYRSLPVDVATGFNLGVGYNSGKAVFVSGAKAQDVQMTLWTVPLDFAMTLEIPLYFLKVGIAGGPSAMGLVQERNDFDYGQKRRRVIQAGIGHFLAARVKISLNEIFPSSGFELLKLNNVTNLYLIAEGRQQSYSKFKSPEVKISGTSFGLGFSFEYF